LGQVLGRYGIPSKSRSPFWYRLAKQKLSGELSSVGTPLIFTVRSPLAKQKPSANSHSAPLAGSLVGQATGPLVPWVVAF